MSTTPDISTDPQLSREEALAILNTPDGELPELIAHAEVLRRKYKDRLCLLMLKHRYGT